VVGTQLNSPNDQPEEGVTAIVVMQDQLRKLLARENLSPRIAVQALLLIGRLFEEQGDARAAVSQCLHAAPRRPFAP